MFDETSLARAREKLRSHELLELLDYWSKLRSNCSMPQPEAIDLGLLETHAPRIILADVVKDPLRFRFTFVGADLQERLGDQLSGQELTEAKPMFFRPYAVCARDVRVTREFASFDFGDEEAPGSFERLLLPLSEDGQEVHAVLGEIVYSNLATRPPAQE